MSTGTIYYYLSQLEPFLKRDESRNYYLTAEGRLLLDKYRENYSEADKNFQKMVLGNAATLGLRKYRSLYDTIAILCKQKVM